MKLDINNEINALFQNEKFKSPHHRDIDHDLSWKTFVSLNKKASEETGDTVIEGIGSNTSLDLYNEYMTNEVIDGFAKQINSAYRKGKPMNQYSNHDLRWENAIAKIIWAKNDNGQLRYRSILNKSHPLYEQAKQMLEDGFTIENSVVIVRVKIQYEENAGKGKDKDAIVSAKLKSIDFVGLGANEETETNLKKSLDSKSGFYHVTKETRHDPKNEMGDKRDMSLFNRKKEAGSSDNNPGDTEDLSEKALDSIKEKVAERLKEDLDKAVKDIVEEVKEEAKQAFKDVFDQEAETKIKELTVKHIDDHLRHREKQALNNDALAEIGMKALETLVGKNGKDIDPTDPLAIGRALAQADKDGKLKGE